LVLLSTGSYRTPSFCSSCLGPRETEVKATVTEKHGNVRTTLTMGFPYCNACAKRAASEKTREILVHTGAAAFGLALAGGAWMAVDAVMPEIGFTLAAFFAVGIAVALAFVTRPSPPPPPATARGQAVILRDTSGLVLCTNQEFANRLAQANSTTARPGSQWFTLELAAPLTALVCGLLLFLMWARYAPPPRASYTPPPPPLPAAQSPAPQQGQQGGAAITPQPKKTPVPTTPAKPQPKGH
jgi:hypothetical protein